jgi:acyl-CoA thioesterase-1
MPASVTVVFRVGVALACLGGGALPACALTVLNQGRCGQNSGITRERFETDVLKRAPKPDYVLIYIGMNDVINHHFFTPVDRYVENVKWMIERSRSAGIVPVVCTIHHVVEEKVYKVHPRELFVPETINRKMERYNAALRKLVADLKVDVADFNAVTDRTPQPEFLSDDGVHLTASGNRLLAKTFYDVIGPRLTGRETIVCVGDSLTFGYRNDGAGTAEGETYPAMLKQMAQGLLTDGPRTVPGGDARRLRPRPRAGGWHLWPRRGLTGVAPQ